MSSLVISGDTSGTVTLAAAAVAGSNTITVQAATGTMSVNTLATAVASTSGTSITFSSIPSWVKRITVMFQGVSTSGTSNILVQIGSGSVVATGYNSMSTRVGTAITGSGTVATTGFIAVINGATDTLNGNMFIMLQSANTWTQSSSFYLAGTQNVVSGGGVSPNLSGALDRVVITTVNGTDTFDAGSINLLYEG